MYRSFAVAGLRLAGRAASRGEPANVTAPKGGAAVAVLPVPGGSFEEVPEMARALDRHVVPELVEREVGGQTLRGWSPACGAGERVYGLAMRLAQQAGPASPTFARRRWFGTALEPAALRCARLGAYAADQVEAQAPIAWQRSFFLRVYDTFHVRGDLRAQCVFGRHDLTLDPPPLHLDLISWQGPLLELGEALSEHLCRAFRFALRPGAFLLLGPREPGPALAGFDAVDAAAGLYRKAGGAAGIQGARAAALGVPVVREAARISSRRMSALSVSPARAAAREEAGLVQRISDALGTAVLVFDEGGSVQLVNRCFEQMLEARASAVVRQPLSRVLPPAWVVAIEAWLGSRCSATGAERAASSGGIPVLLRREGGTEVYRLRLSALDSRRWLVAITPAAAATHELQSSARAALPSQGTLGLGAPRRRERAPLSPGASTALSPREREVLTLLAEGGSSKSIAERLRISTTTVETHRRHIMDKLERRSIAELTKYAVREGLTKL